MFNEEEQSLINQYISLHCHTDGQRDGVQTVKELIQYGKDNNKSSLSITDHGVMNNALDFYYKCKDANINPILGCEFYYVFDVDDKYELVKDPKAKTGFKKKQKKPFHLILLAKNLEGYQILIKLTNEAQKHFYGKPRIDANILRKYIAGKEGNIVCLTACMKSPLFVNMNHTHELYSIFKNDLYLELQYHGYNPTKEIEYMNCLIASARANNFNLILTNDVHINKKEDIVLHRLLTAIDRKVHINSPEASYMQGEGYHNLVGNEIYELFENVLDRDIFFECLRNVKKVQEECSIKLPYKKGQFIFPEIKTPVGFTSNFEYLKHLTYNSFRFNKELHLERLERELKVYNDCGFVDYILPIQDIVFYAKKNGIEVGVGRGSAAGSLINYLLEITQIDPMVYGLSFDRFITTKYNPEKDVYENARLTAPDVDLDFSNNNAVFDYVKKKYGKDKVCGIGTKLIYKPKSAFKEAMRAHLIEPKTQNILSKFIPDTIHSLSEIINNLPDELKAYHGIIELAIRLEGRIATTSTHAAGAVFSDNLQNHIPLSIDKKALKQVSGTDYERNSDSQAGVDGEDEIVEDEENVKYISQYSMDDIKNTGFTKYDLLGLATLNVLKKCQQLTGIKWDDLDPFDPKYEEVYKNVFGKGKTTGVFQVASDGMRKLLIDMMTSEFKDVQDANALYRPQILEQGLDKLYIKNKKEGYKSIHTIIDGILAPTNGVPIYQEQVLDILTKSGKLEAFEADTFRRILSDNKTNTDPEQLKKLHAYTESFIKGAIENGMTKEQATLTYEELSTKSGYSFNKSHSASYAFTAFACAFYKYYYPLEFIIADIGEFPQDIGGLIQEHPDPMSVRIEFPNINISDYDPSIQEDEKGKYILMGLRNIFGFGDSAIDELVMHRPYKYETLSQVHKYIEYKQMPKEQLSQLTKEEKKMFESFLGDLDICRKNKLNSKSLLMLLECGAFLPANEEYFPTIEQQIKHFGDELKNKLTEDVLLKIKKWHLMEQILEVNPQASEFLISGVIINIIPLKTKKDKDYYRVKVKNPLNRKEYVFQVWEKSFEDSIDPRTKKIKKGFINANYKVLEPAVFKLYKPEGSPFMNYVSGDLLENK